MRKPTIYICENKGADQLHGNREADQRLCFRYTDSTIPLLLKSEISSFKPASVLCVGPGKKNKLWFPHAKGSFCKNTNLCSIYLISGV